MIAHIEERDQSRRIEVLKRLIDDEDYISAAISRIAQVLSDELIDRRPPGEPHERQRQASH